MELVEYIVFFGLLVFTFTLFIRYLPAIRKEQAEDPQTINLLKCESPIEERLYKGLLQHGLFATPQYKVPPYRLDFAFPEHMLVIECDGKAYHSTPRQKAHDRKRDKYLRSKGWTVLRFSGRKIHRELPEVVDKIKLYTEC